MTHIIPRTIKRATKAVYSRITNRALKKTIVKFTEKVGLVYFGYVNQHTDDHKVVRGLSVSSTHQDDHYSVGAIGGYNVTLVDRSDVVLGPDESTTIFNWLIMSFDLKTDLRIPHFFIGAHNRDIRPYEALFSTFPNMKQVNLGTFENYNPEFTSRFSVYARPAKSIEVERLLPAKTMRVLGAHFWPFSAEQHDNVLYLYSTNERITPSLLENMLENGLWLAGHLDMQSELV